MLLLRLPCQTTRLLNTVSLQSLMRKLHRFSGFKANYARRPIHVPWPAAGWRPSDPSGPQFRMIVRRNEPRLRPAFPKMPFLRLAPLNVLSTRDELLPLFSSHMILHFKYIQHYQAFLSVVREAEKNFSTSILTSY